ncbi:MAG: NAD-dependent protein deacylase [Chloroflexi bacterium]|nr:NAD-dependent protein deacylase [Chloroflexota bacterium]
MTFTLPDHVLHRLIDARRIVVLTGGGVAAESGVPSFGAAHTGKWAQYDVSELATPQAFVRNPRLVWEWYDYRRGLAEKAQPGATHYALVHLEQYYPAFTLITQTIDGLHWRAGSRDLIELNGSLRRSRCFEAGHIALTWEDDGEIPPHCTQCGSLLRPDVVMFGEGLPHSELRRARLAVEQCDVFMCAGSVGAIEPIASFPFVARRSGAFVLTIAPDESIYTLMADYVVPTTPGVIMPELVKLIAGDVGGLEELQADAF